MPPEPLSGADLDLLADYREGLLDDADAMRVATLVATDPNWAAASAALGSATAQVQASLSDLAVPRETMPDDIAARIDRALESQPRPPASLAAARERRHRAIHRVRLAAAALILVALSGGVAYLTASQQSTKSSSSTATEARPETASIRAGVVITFSGRDYTAATLGEPLAAYGTDKSLGTKPNPAAPRTTTPGFASTPAKAPLVGSGLPIGASLDQCLVDIRQLTGGAPTTVDYGTFNRTPALIVRVTSPDLVVAVGAACGSPEGTDLLARATPR